MIPHVAVIHIVADRGGFIGAMVMNRYGGVLVAAEQTGKRRAHGQEREKADDDAVPFHDPKQGE